MKDEDKTKEQLIGELVDLRRREADLKRLEAEYKKTENALREREERYGLTTRAGQVGVWDWNLETNEIYVDPNLKAMLGYEDDEIRNHLDDWGKLVHPDDMERVMTQANAHLEGLTPQYEIEHRMLHKNGGIRWFLARGAAFRDTDGRPYRVVGTDTDITQRKEMEGALRESEERFRTLVSNAPIGLSIIAKDGTYEYVNPQFVEMFGYTLEELPNGKNWFEKAYPDPGYRQKVIACWREDLRRATGDQTRPRVFTVTCKDGSEKEILFRPVSLTDGRQLVTHEDITELKRAEEAIRESEERFRGIFENTTIGLYRTTPEGRILMANPTLLHMLGYSSFKELAQRNLEKKGYEPNYSRSTFKRRIESEGQVIGLESAWQKRDGTTLFVRESARVISDEAGNVQYYEGTVEDITERKQAEEGLRESEERLRLLSSHLLTVQETERRRISIELHDELGQALIALKHRLRSVERKLPEDQTRPREECESALKYVDQVIEDVRRLSRDLKPSLLEELGLSAALQRLLDDFAKRFRMEISLGGADIDTLFSREAQIVVYRIFQEALTNIAKHAEATHVSIVARKQDRSVSFLVEDNGRGFDIKRLPMKNPTKRGLGLTAMEERALMLGGSLDISSQEGTGTRVSFTIPMRRDGS